MTSSDFEIQSVFMNLWTLYIRSNFHVHVYSKFFTIERKMHAEDANTHTLRQGYKAYRP